ncbi:MAG: tetratricopeptide repeat protein [Rhizobiales bacterium]|nr:tetratricopeptide repeat protein [Hyphomicrobiales bacterium]
MSDSAVLPDAIDAALAHDAFTTAYLSHAKDVPQRLSAFLAADPANPRGPAARAILLTTLARVELVGPARLAAEEASTLLAAGSFSLADSAFVDAARHAALGLWREAIGALERAIRFDPSDTLSVKMAHGLRFMLGDAPGMLRSIDASLARLPLDHAHLGFLMGCKAFALEETGRYAEAERVGLRAIELRPDDAWGLHAISHVHEMTGRIEQGIALIESHDVTVRASNNFGGHLFWHLALFRLERGEVGEALTLYDREIRREKTDDFRDIANAASLLMRIDLMGYATGDRWEELADKAEARIDDRSLLFADLHYALALMGAGRTAKARRLAQSMSTLAPRPLAQEPAWHAAGIAMGRGLEAFIAGDMGKAFSALSSLKRPAQSIGGSHAQRDILEQITIEAGLRAGADGAVRQRLMDRLAARGGHNLFAESKLARLAQKTRPGLGVMSLVAALAHGRDPAGHHA